MVKMVGIVLCYPFRSICIAWKMVPSNINMKRIEAGGLSVEGARHEGCGGNTLSDPWPGKGEVMYVEREQSDGESLHNTIQYDA